MSETSERGLRSEQRFVDSTIIPHPKSQLPRILVVPQAAGWALPALSSSERHFWQTTLDVNRRLADEFGIHAVALRCVQANVDDAERCVYEMDTLRLPEGPIIDGRWVTLAELDHIDIHPPGDRPLMERWLRERASGHVLQLRPAWSQPGWYGLACAWIEQRLAERGRALTSPIEQVRSWGRSTVLRAPATGGDVYLKAVPTMFAHEVSLTRYLDERFAGRGVSVLAIDDTRGWLLMEALPGTTLEDIRALAAWQRAFRSLAELQIALIDARDDLIGLGCPVRSLGDLRAAMPGIACDAALQLLDSPGGLTHEQSQQLRACVPQLQAACDELDEYAIPESLEHGDLHPANIVVDGLHDRFFDWSDCAVSHPFFTLVLYFEDTAGALEQDEITRFAIRDAYLEPWRRALPDRDLERAFEFAQLLAPVAYAWMYQTRILPGLEQHWEMNRMAPHYLRTTLKRLLPGT